eukprot:3861544-Rhodomonas_salina.1
MALRREINRISWATGYTGRPKSFATSLRLRPRFVPDTVEVDCVQIGLDSVPVSAAEALLGVLAELLGFRQSFSQDFKVLGVSEGMEGLTASCRRRSRRARLSPAPRSRPGHVPVSGGHIPVTNSMVTARSRPGRSMGTPRSRSGHVAVTSLCIRALGTGTRKPTRGLVRCGIKATHARSWYKQYCACAELHLIPPPHTKTTFQDFCSRGP